MEPSIPQDRERAHTYLDYLSAAQVSIVRGLLEAMLDPVTQALAVAPIDDESVTPEEARAVAEARESLEKHGGIPFEQVVAQLGFTMEEITNYRQVSLHHVAESARQ